MGQSFINGEHIICQPGFHHEIWVLNHQKNQHRQNSCWFLNQRKGMWREQDKLLWLTIYIYISISTHMTINTWSYYGYVVQNFVNFSEVIYIYVYYMYAGIMICEL